MSLNKFTNGTVYANDSVGSSRVMGSSSAAGGSGSINTETIGSGDAHNNIPAHTDVV